MTGIIREEIEKAKKKIIAKVILDGSPCEIEEYEDLIDSLVSKLEETAEDKAVKMDCMCRRDYGQSCIVVEHKPEKAVTLKTLVGDKEKP